MSNVETIIAKDRDDLVNTAAEFIALRFTTFAKTNREFHVAITGGTVGTLTLEALRVLTQDIDLSRLHIWWVDERFVGEQSQDRNELQARRAWLSSSSISEQNIHPFPAEESGSIEFAAESFARTIEAINPKFELVLLGIGEDGHVASLFPDSDGTRVGDWIVIEKNSPKPPVQRLSLSLRAINNSKEVLFLVSGIEKAKAVSEVFSGVSDLPAEKVVGSIKTTWILDEDAASGVTSS
jgi:6-phosphogluconolactonase